MEKEQFIHFVADTIKNNPSWFGDMIKATQIGVLERLREDKHHWKKIVLNILNNKLKEDGK